jgi:hypothetical protein
MTQRGQSDSEHPDWGAPNDWEPTVARSLEWLGEELLSHQAGMTIDYLADHGWQVGLNNPGGSVYVYACEGEEKWPADGGPSLSETIEKAIGEAKTAGWW